MFFKKKFKVLVSKVLIFHRKQKVFQNINYSISKVAQS